jgi:hypothetical protein
LASQRVAAQVQHLHAGEEAQRLRHAPRQVVVQEQRLPDPAAGVPVRRREGPREPVVGERDDGSGRRPQRLRDLALELVVVEEHGVEVLGEELRRQLPGEAVEPEVHEHQRGDQQRGGRERPRQEVVAEVQLGEVLQAAHRVRNAAGEPVAVEVEEGEVREAREEVARERAAEVGAVQVDAGDHRRRAAVGRRGAVDALVRAHVRAPPRRQRAVRVLRHGRLQRLQRRVLRALLRGLPGRGGGRRRRAVDPGANGGAEAELGGRGGEQQQQEHGGGGAGGERWPPPHGSRRGEEIFSFRCADAKSGDSCLRQWAAVQEATCCCRACID